jgi:hypothetical protein
MSEIRVCFTNAPQETAYDYETHGWVRLFLQESLSEIFRYHFTEDYGTFAKVAKSELTKAEPSRIVRTEN